MRSRMSSERRGGIATGPALLVARYFKPLISETPSARGKQVRAPRRTA